MNEKISQEHLHKAAYVYVRQSSLQQVRDHRESQKRQYALADRAKQLGFVRVFVIDEDQGRSGSGLQDRPGFGELLAIVCQGVVGAVFALEASRLARNNRDWHHLVDLCALTGTLMVDHDGIYDPRHVNDRLLLGLKGSLAEFELGLLRQRAREAFEQKVRRGCLMWEPSVGFIRTEDHRIEMIPDRQVQQALRGVFQKFRELGSARQTAIWYSQEQIRLPEAEPGTAGQRIVWRIPGRHRILQILKNPCYAGAFAWGRTATKTIVEDGRARQAGRCKKPMDQWKVLILKHHPAYISWDEFLRNREMLEDNVAQRDGSNAGAAKAGSALLSGLLRCGHCGRKLFVRYSGVDGRVPRYLCSGGRSHRGSAPCITVGGLGIDRAVVQMVLDAIQPAGIQAALVAVDQTLAENDQKRRSLVLALEKAHYEAGRARRQFDAVDPENRLVAGELESRWNATLTEVAELESRIVALEDNGSRLTEAQREHLLRLGADLPSLWNHSHASVHLKKRILRTVVQEVIISGKGDATEHLLKLHWKGGVHTELRIKRNQRGKHSRATDRQCLELIGELSKVCDDRTIASILNRLGYRTGHGKSWLSSRIAEVRSYYRLPNYEKRKDWLTMEQAADELQVSCTVIRRLIKERTLSARQVVACAPWIIERKDMEKPAVQSAIRTVREGRKLPRTALGQHELPLEIP